MDVLIVEKYNPLFDVDVYETYFLESMESTSGTVESCVDIIRQQHSYFSMIEIGTLLNTWLCLASSFDFRKREEFLSSKFFTKEQYDNLEKHMENKYNKCFASWSLDFSVWEESQVKEELKKKLQSIKNTSR